MEPPTLNIPGEVTFVLQAGILKESVTVNVNDFSFEKLKEITCSFLDKKVLFVFSLHFIHFY